MIVTAEVAGPLSGTPAIVYQPWSCVAFVIRESSSPSFRLLAASLVVVAEGAAVYSAKEQQDKNEPQFEVSPRVYPYFADLERTLAGKWWRAFFDVEIESDEQMGQARLRLRLFYQDLSDWGRGLWGRHLG